MNITLKQAIELIAVRSDPLTAAVVAVCGPLAYVDPAFVLTQVRAISIAEHINAQDTETDPEAAKLLGVSAHELTVQAERNRQAAVGHGIDLLRLAGLRTPMCWIDA